MTEENISQEFRLKNTEETRNYFIKEIHQNELMSKKHKKVSTILNYNEHFLILASAVTGCISISAFTSLLDITSSAIGLKIYVTNARIKKYKSIIKEKKRKHNKIVLLRKTNLNSIEVFFSKTLTSSNISHD